MHEPLLEAIDVKKHFTASDASGRKGTVYAVDGVSFGIGRNETLGVVGESGCGKSTLGRTILRLLEPTSGTVRFGGADITRGNMRPYRSRMQIIFQNPVGSLDPRMRVRDIIAEAFTARKDKLTRAEKDETVFELLSKVGLNSEHAQRFPHEFSGGQQQRIGIARALAVNPEFIVCDEPVSALDVSYQSQIVNLLEDMQRELGLSYLFIAHDLSVVRHISNRIAVMYLGRIVELSPSAELVFSPAHPYTVSLVSAVPIPDPRLTRQRERIPLAGEIPSALNPPEGCRFRTRCGQATELCGQSEPELKEISPGHLCACHKV